MVGLLEVVLDDAEVQARDLGRDDVRLADALPHDDLPLQIY
jgi:hypothetical protein